MENHYRTVENRNLEEICKAQEDRIAALYQRQREMAKRIVVLMGEVQKLTSELEASHAAIKQAMEHL